MSRNVRRDEFAVSLFSFQDIIMCLSGIMILIVLVLTISLARLRTLSPFESFVGDLGDEIYALQLERERLIGLVEEKRSQEQQGSREVEDIRNWITERARNQKLARETSTINAVLNIESESLAAVLERLSELQGKVSSVEEGITDLRLQLSNTMASNEIGFIPATGGGKSAIIVECSGGQFRVGKIGESASVRAFPSTREGMAPFA